MKQRPEILPDGRMKCEKCRQGFDWKQFAYDGQTKSQICVSCLSCRYKARIQFHNSLSSVYGSGETFTYLEWMQVLEKHNFKCAYCSAEHLIEIDHIVARVDGGINHISNIQPLCYKCNLSKNKTLKRSYVRSR